MEHGAEDERLSGLYRVSEQKPRDSLLARLAPRRQQAMGDRDEELPRLRVDHVEVVNQRLGQLAAKGVDDLHPEAVHRPSGRDFDPRHRRLKDHVVHGVRREVHAPEVDDELAGARRLDVGHR